MSELCEVTRFSVRELIATATMHVDESLPVFDLTTAAGCRAYAEFLAPDFPDVKPELRLEYQDACYIRSFPGSPVELTVWRGARVLVPASFAADQNSGRRQRPLRGYVAAPERTG